MSLDKTFKKLRETFDQLNSEVGDLFGEKGGESVQIVGDLTIRTKNGSVDIRGPMRELRINGRLVRFKEKP